MSTSRLARVCTAIAALSATALFLSACSSAGGAGGDGQPTKVGFAAASINNAFVAGLAADIESDSRAANFDLQTISAEIDPAKQANDVNTLVSSGAKGLIIDAVNADAIGGPIDRAAAAGAKVVVVDSAAAANENIAMQVLTDNVSAGQQACKMIGDMLGGRGTTLNLQGLMDNPAARDRSDGYLNCMAESYPDMTVISKPFNWDAVICSQIVSTQFSTTQIDGVFAAAGYCLGPVKTALESQNRLITAGEPGHMPFVVVDGTPEQLDAVREGYLTASIVQPVPELAQAAVDWLGMAMNNETIAEGPTDRGTTVTNVDGTLRELIPPVVATLENVDDPNLWANSQ